jgi:MFS family permease
VNQPTRSAVIPRLLPAEQLPAANALGGSAWGTMLIVGASLGGIMSQRFSPYVCFGVDLFCCVV